MTKTNLSLDADRLWADIMALAEITDPARPWTRRSFTALFLEGRAWLANRFAEAGLVIPDEQEDEVEKFREFLDTITPEDFGRST